MTIVRIDKDSDVYVWVGARIVCDVRYTLRYVIVYSSKGNSSLFNPAYPICALLLALSYLFATTPPFGSRSYSLFRTFYL